MKFRLPKKLAAAILAAQMIAAAGTTVAYGEETAVPEKTHGSSVGYGETTWAPTDDVTKVSYKNNTVTGYGNGVLELETSSSKTRTLNITGFDSVDFVDNTDTYSGGNGGGAILMDVDGETTLNIYGNTAVNISGNSISTTAAINKAGNVSGAGLYMTGKAYTNITGNVDVTFEGNSSYSPNHQSRGAAIYAGDYSGSPSVNISSNTGTVSFKNNITSAGRNHAQGGAIYVSSNLTSLTLNKNAILSFTNNQVSNTGGIVQGGAIHNTSTGVFEIAENTEVIFSGNSATCAPNNTMAINSHKPVGGAIYSTNENFSIVGNTSVSFTNNFVSLGELGTETDGYEVKGGAIYAAKGFRIQGNDTVTFSGNYEKEIDAYRLRAIYGQSDTAYYISANDKGSVEFQDGIYLSNINKNKVLQLHLNSDYGDKAQTGSITMTGAYTKTLLENIKGEGNVTEEEIANSQRFELLGKTTLYGGTLKVEDGANFIGNGFETANAANATVELTDATFDHGTNAVTFASGSSLVTSGTVTLNAGTFTMAEGSSLSIDALADATTVEYGLFGGSIDSASIDGTVNVTLSIDSDYLKSFANEAAFSIKLLDATTLTGNYTQGSLTYGNLDYLVWSTGDLTLETKDNALYVSGTLTRNEAVNITDGSENDSDFAGNTKLNVSGDVTLSGDNTHTGGTIISGASADDNSANLTLGSESALGAGSVIVREGVDANLTTSEDVTATLPTTIQNLGNLTLSGSFDVSGLDATGTEADTHVNVYGQEGNNGFFRDGDTVITVVENGDHGILIVGDDTVITKDGNELHLAESGKAGELTYSIYYITESTHTAAMSAIQDMSGDQTTSVVMSTGTLEADEDVTNVQATGGAIEADGDVSIGGNLAGSTTVKVVNGTAELSGANSYNGPTIIEGSESTLVVKESAALGKSTVYLQEHGTLNLNSQAVSNDIYVEGCTICDAANYTGNITVSGDLELVDNTNDHIARANKVTFVGAGNIASSNATLVVNSVEMATDATGEINSDLTTNEGGTIILNNGSQLKVNGALTLGKGTTFVLKGEGWAKDSKLGYGDPTVDSITTGSATLANGHGTYAIEDGVIYLTAVFDNSIADALTVSNWGIASASRTFVNAVRGQRSNNGCIANGRGTAWAAVLGGTSDIGNGDIDLKGAAVGADMKVGEKSSVGVAVGYIDGDAKIPGMSKAEQEGTYVALYGEHGLKKLSDTSCLSLDWVAAYGQTETEWKSADWEQDSLQLNTRLNWNKKVTDRLCLSVFGGLEYFTSESDCVENAKTGSIQNLRGEIGVGARYVAWGAPGTAASYDEKGALVTASRPGCEKLVLHGEIRYMNDLVRSNPVIEQDGLRGDGENPGRQGMGIEAGATYRIGERWSASANYSFNAMDYSREHRVNVGASYTF